MRGAKTLAIPLIITLLFYAAMFKWLESSCRTIVMKADQSQNVNLRKEAENTLRRAVVERIRTEKLERYSNESLPVENVDLDLARCRSLLEGQQFEKRNELVPDLTSDMDVVDILRDGCQSFQEKYQFPLSNVYQSHIAVNEEINFPIAYSVVIHKGLNQLALLLSAIYRKQNVYCIHVDRKSDSIFKTGVQLISQCFENVFLSTKSERVVYASFSRLQADINCMTDLLHIPNTMYNWTYLINLCGQDFPIYTNYEMVKQLKMLQGKNLIPGTRKLNGYARRRTEFIHRTRNVTKGNKTVEVDVPTKEKHSLPPYNMTQIKNLAYNAFTRDFLQWSLVDSPVGAALLNWSSHTHTPDEHFWSMLNTYPEAPGGSQFVSWWSVVRGVMWKGNKAQDNCHGYWQRGVCVFGAEDLPWLMKTAQMFMNKFDVTFDVTPVKCLRKFIDLRTNGLNSTWNQNKKPLKPPKEMLTSRANSQFSNPTAEQRIVHFWAYSLLWSPLGRLIV